MSKAFDLTSDIHLDFWVKTTDPLVKQIELIDLLINKLLPVNPANTIVIAGDLGHANWQNILFLETLRKYYSNVVLVHGNHDFYLISKNQKSIYKNDSYNRINEMITLASNIPGVYYLDGTKCVELDGITYGGTGMWYDDSYAENVWNMDTIATQDLWYDHMNDGKCIIRPNGSYLRKRAVKPFNRYEAFIEQYNLLEQHIGKCDVIVTHISPTYEFLQIKFNCPESTFYHFNGSAMLDRLNESNVWCYGHTHDQYLNTHKNGCLLACNPLGYPQDSYMGHSWIKYPFNERMKISNVVIGAMKYDELFSSERFK